MRAESSELLDDAAAEAASGVARGLGLEVVGFFVEDD
jgi:hypothetical protein